MALVDDDDMLETLAADRTDQAFAIKKGGLLLRAVAIIAQTNATNLVQVRPRRWNSRGVVSADCRAGHEGVP